MSLPPDILPPPSTADESARPEQLPALALADVDPAVPAAEAHHPDKHPSAHGAVIVYHGAGHDIPLGLFHPTPGIPGGSMIPSTL